MNEIQWPHQKRSFFGKLTKLIYVNGVYYITVYVRSSDSKQNRHERKRNRKPVTCEHMCPFIYKNACLFPDWLWLCRYLRTDKWYCNRRSSRPLTKSIHCYYYRYGTNKTKIFPMSIYVDMRSTVYVCTNFHVCNPVLWGHME